MTTLLIIAFFVGFAVGVTSTWLEARAQYGRGHREGYDLCENRYCQRITDEIRRVRVECGLPAEPPPPPAPQPLVNDLMSKWSGKTQVTEQNSLNDYFANGGDYR